MISIDKDYLRNNAKPGQDEELEKNKNRRQSLKINSTVFIKILYLISKIFINLDKIDKNYTYFYA